MCPIGAGLSLVVFFFFLLLLGDQASEGGRRRRREGERENWLQRFAQLLSRLDLSTESETKERKKERKKRPIRPEGLQLWSSKALSLFLFPFRKR